MRKIILITYIFSFVFLYRFFNNEQLSLYYLIFLMIGAMYLEDHLKNLREKIFINKSRILVLFLSVMTLPLITNLDSVFTLGLIIFLFLILFKIQTDTAIQYAAYIFVSIPLSFVMKAIPTAELLTTCLFWLLIEITAIYIFNHLINYGFSKSQLNLQ